MGLGLENILEAGGQYFLFTRLSVFLHAFCRPLHMLYMKTTHTPTRAENTEALTFRV